MMRPYLLFIMLLAASDAFVFRPPTRNTCYPSLVPTPAVSFGGNAVKQPTSQISAAALFCSHSNTRLYANYNDGTGRGAPILFVVLLACLWLFTLPPEFRRAYICQSERCLENRAACYDCVSAEEWRNGIAEYYKNGGGIQWDFSIDPKNKLF